MKVNEDNMEQSSPYPDRPGERDCQFFLRTGQCGYGNTCRYNHPLTHLPQVRNLVYMADSSSCPFSVTLAYTVCNIL